MLVHYILIKHNYYDQITVSDDIRIRMIEIINRQQFVYDIDYISEFWNVENQDKLFEYIYGVLDNSNLLLGDEEYYEDPVYLFNTMRMNMLVKSIYANGNPDWIIPLSKYYYAKWRIYVPNEGEDNDRISVPHKQSLCFDDSHKTMYTVILSRHVLKNYNTLIVQGNHDVVNSRSKPGWFRPFLIF